MNDQHFMFMDDSEQWLQDVIANHYEEACERVS
ncbi:hypothetical protein SAMN06265373_1291, partial [Shimia sagamensis]